jgi:hypothetical protein
LVAIAAEAPQTFNQANETHRDIVDAEPADGNVWKMLLGAVNKWFDGDKDEDDSDKTTQES